ncbi:dihydrolipoyl dehydrogenase [Bacillus sp. CRN 9]|nr:dihydrolipoyl dehydrogenase [Bacillus sp. CRN 9]
MVVGEIAHERDLIIIGGGAGGYQAAIRASQLGRKVTLFEKEELGGLCLNKGCIPSKILTAAASSYVNSKENTVFGIEYGQLLFHFDKLQEYKKKTIETLKQGISALCKSNKIEVIKGSAYFLTNNKVGVESGEQYEVYRFNHAIIATGSTPSKIEGITPDYIRIHDSYSITSLETFPNKLIVYGNDYLSIEIAMAYEALGTQVTMLMEEADFPYDLSINRELRKNLKRHKIKLITNAKISKVNNNRELITVNYYLNDRTLELEATHLFTAVKPSPNTKDLGLERIGIITNESNCIIVNEECRTSLSHIFAIGDVTEGPSLAIKAIKQGKVAAEAATGIRSEIDLRFLPIVAHTRPPLASVGLTEQQAIQSGYQVEIGQFSLSGSGFAAILGKKHGFVKVIKDKQNHVLLGIHMIGEGAVEMISTGVTALEMAARDEDIIFPLYPHPSMNEALMEAAEALRDQAIHVVSTRLNEKQKV